MSITFYPTVARDQLSRIATTRVLLTASSYAAEEMRRYGKVRRDLPTPTLPDWVTERAADCGGFVATFKWGEYPYTPAQYVRWLRTWRPQWAATMDFCCEDEITNSKPGVVRERQQKTTEMAWHFWQTYQEESWAWVPTIQGWTIEDYQRHATEMKPLIDEMKVAYADNPDWRVGIGTLCRRASVQMIHDVTRAVAAILPGIPLHLWGIKLGALQSPLALPEQVASVDSAAWNGLFGRDREECKASGLPQRQWSWDVAYPRYEAKVIATLAQPKQLSLLDCEAVI